VIWLPCSKVGRNLVVPFVVPVFIQICCSKVGRNLSYDHMLIEYSSFVFNLYKQKAQIRTKIYYDRDSRNIYVII
jgi:hypothetical protein